MRNGDSASSYKYKYYHHAVIKMKDVSFQFRWNCMYYSPLVDHTVCGHGSKLRYPNGSHISQNLALADPNLKKNDLPIPSGHIIKYNLDLN